MFRLNGSKHFSFEYQLNDILDVNFFYVDEVLPLVNPRYFALKATSKLSECNNIHDEIFAFFIFVFFAFNSGIKNIIPFFQQESFDVSQYSSEIKKIVGFLNAAHDGIKQTVFRNIDEKNTMPRSNCKNFQNKCFKPLYLLFYNLRKMIICHENEELMVKFIKNRQSVKLPEENCQTNNQLDSTASYQDRELSLSDVDFAETSIPNDVFQL